jgi:cysteinyl-tRNA synthetase
VPSPHELASTPMALQLFNTRSRRIETLVPIDALRVQMYCCGPTVYNYAHIGNLRTYVCEDILRRTLELFGYSVVHVMNITDVGHLQSDADTGEDKMEVAARREQKSPWELARHYESEFFRHTDLLRIKRPTIVCRATEHISEMIAMISRLIERGHAYVVDGNVYFDVATFPAYAEFAGLDLQNQAKTSRVEPDPRKRSIADFVLWFSQSKYPNQVMKWPSPWGTGFPGWHIECSAMASKYLGKHFDIHCGGIDHIPVHHTNEIAQSEGCYGCKWVNCWLHGEFLEVDETKMSKSSGRFLHLDQLKEDGFTPLAYRYLLLTAHYRSKLRFSYESLEAAQRSFTGLINLMRQWRRDAKSVTTLRHEAVAEMQRQFHECLSNDLHLPEAVALAWTVARDQGTAPKEKLVALSYFDRVFGLDLDVDVSVALSEGQMSLIERREEARRRKDWKTADRLRAELATEGVHVRDGPTGPEWEVVDANSNS